MTIAVSASPGPRFRKAGAPVCSSVEQAAFDRLRFLNGSVKFDSRSQLIDLHSTPISRDRISAYRIGQGQSGGIWQGTAWKNLDEQPKAWLEQVLAQRS